MVRWNMFTVVAAATLSLGGSVSALACQGTSVAFRDDFKTLEPSWQGFAGKTANAADGHLVLTTIDNGGQDSSNHMLNQSNVYQDAIICARVKYATTADMNATSAGIIFWGLNDNSFYIFMTSPMGYFTIQRKIASGRVISPVAWTASPVVKKGLEQTQELQVVTKGNLADVFVDGVKVADVKGDFPVGGQLVGVYWSAPGSTTSRIIIDNLSVKN